MRLRWAGAPAVLLWLAACGGAGAPDPCASAACDQPPPDACAAGSTTRALRYPATGTCAPVAGAASCDYEPVLVDCAASGQVCQAGACVAPDPCAGVACASPPADACATGTLLLRYPGPGTCVAEGGAAACHYAPEQVDCAASGLVCQAGACAAPPDPCAGVACASPPPPTCVGAAVRQAHDAPGTCAPVGGQPACDYPVSLTDCALAGQVCVGGACVAPPPCAAPDACTSPPPDACASPVAALHYPAAGACAEVEGQAACRYEPALEDCGAAGLGCRAGACVDPCADAGACGAPPADACASATVLLDYGPAGACAVVAGEARCDHQPAVVDCAALGLGCRDGACADPCAAPGACASPPADACASARTRLVYPATGACAAVAGLPACDYAPAQVACPAGQVCAAGACVADPCAIPADGAGFIAYAAWTDGAAGYDLRAVRLDGTCDQPLAGGPGDDLDPAWSRATGRLAWSATREGSGRIAALDLADGTERLLDTGAGLASAPAFTPNGQFVIFEDRALASTQADLRYAPWAGGAGGRVFSFSYQDLWTEAGPAVAADGKIYFVSDREGLGVYASDLSGLAVTHLILDPDLLGKPAVSADGTRLAYARTSATPGSLSQVVVHDLRDHTSRVLSDQGDSEPAFPATGVQVDGREVLAVRTTRHGLTDVVLLDLATGAEVRRLTDGARLVGAPAFPR